MRGLNTCALAAVLLATTLGTTSAAQTGGSRPIQHVFVATNLGVIAQYQGGGLPYGDYQQTCRNIRNNGYRLDATCQQRNGNWRNTSLDYRGCRSSIVNDNGHLRCSDNGGYSDRWHGGVPPGNYRQTCRNVRVDGNWLTATCQKRNGGWRDTSLKNFNYCRSEIENDNGHLRCR
jgi:hypothetical protein